MFETSKTEAKRTAHERCRMMWDTVSHSLRPCQGCRLGPTTVGARWLECLRAGFRLGNRAVSSVLGYQEADPKAWPKIVTPRPRIVTLVNPMILLGKPGSSVVCSVSRIVMWDKVVNGLSP